MVLVRSAMMKHSTGSLNPNYPRKMKVKKAELWAHWLSLEEALDPVGEGSLLLWASDGWAHLTRWTVGQESLWQNTAHPQSHRLLASGRRLGSMLWAADFIVCREQGREWWTFWITPAGGSQQRLLLHKQELQPCWSPCPLERVESALWVRSLEAMPDVKIG